MSPKEYVQEVLKTELRNAKEAKKLKARFSAPLNMRLLHAVLGFSSELAEVQEAVEKDPTDLTNLMEEMGDLYWYMAILADEFDAANLVFVNNDTSAIKTARPSDARGLLQQNVHYMVRNAGSIADIVKKAIMYGKEIDPTLVVTYLRGLDFSINQSLRLYGMTSQAAREANINKLSDKKNGRYANGFTEKAALTPDKKAERSVLEKSTQS